MDTSTYSLSGRTLVVTGASSGIGRAIALLAARAGADVAITYRQNQRGALDAVQEIQALGRRAEAFQLDIAHPSAIHSTALAARERLGRIDAWVNNAGADILTGAGESMSRLEKLDLLLAVDLRGTMIASWEVAELLGEQPDGGVIINISWDHALAGMRGLNPQLFSAVKGGVLAFSKSLARSVAPRVRVNIVAPGWIDTAFGAGLEAAKRQEVAETIPLGRWGTPDDVAGAVVYLASPAASYLTGHTLVVGGGAVI